MISNEFESLPQTKKPFVFLLVSHVTPIGGAERQALYYAKIIEEQGFDAAVLARQIDEQHLASCAPDITARTDILAALWTNPGCILVSFLAADHAFCAALKLTGLFNFHWLPFERTHPDFYWKGFARTSGVALKIKRAAIKFAYAYFADALLCQTASAAESWRQIFQPFRVISVQVIPNAFNVPDVRAEIAAVDGRPVRLVMVGRLTAAKDYSFALKVVQIIKSRGIVFVLTVMGVGELSETLAEEAARLGVGNEVRFAGLVRNAGLSLAQYDLFLMTSRVEGMPNALGEAMAIGLPCLTLDFNAGPRELLGFAHSEGQQQIVLVRDPNLFADQLCLLINAPELRQKLGAYNRQRVAQHFSADKIGAAFDSVIRPLCER